MIDLHLGDILEWAAAYSGPKFHALLCDPPYHLTSIVERFGKPDAAPAKGDVYARSSRGFMGKEWDGGAISFRPETWAALAAHLLPGAFGMAFASARGSHRLACAIEDAGMVIHPSIFWCYGSGFPKATRVKGGGEVWDGHRYGLQAIKPAAEPVIVFQKPYEGRPVDCITETGAGALNIEAGRIGTEGGGTHCTNRDASGKCLGHNNGGRSTENPTYHGPEIDPAGRWPANLVLSHLPTCNGTCADGCPVKALGEQSGERGGGFGIRGGRSSTENWRLHHDTGQEVGFGDTGTAARFFYQAAWNLDEADPFCYVAKASRRERDAGLDGMPLKPGGSMEANAGDVMQLGGASLKGEHKPRQMTRNGHPTVKPLSLARYLATLLLPPAEYAPRRILIPFAGSGSECIGASLAGWEEVTGIEREQEYIDIARARADHWTKEPAQMEMSL